jgi:GT2 family glycosyltransferase
MHKPSISVVVITKNQAWNIGRLLDSVFAELGDFPNAEVILADSVSTDETVSIASTYPGVKIVRLRGDQRLTPAAGRYVGFHHASGDLILCLDGDTELIPGWLRAGIQLLEERSEVAGAGGLFIELPKDAPTRSAGDTLMRENSVRDVPFLCGRVCLYRRAVLDQVGTFNPFLLAEEEAELALRIRQAGYRLVKMQQSAVFHRSDEPPETFSDALARWRRNFLFAEGQVLRHLYGSRLFWTFARERGFALVPGLALLVGLGTFVASVATGDWRWLECFLVLAILVTATLAIRKRSLYKAVQSIFVHLLLVAGTIKGALIETPDPSTYFVGSKESVNDSKIELVQGERPALKSVGVN